MTASRPASSAELVTAIGARRSIRRYRTDELPWEQIERLLEAAIRAPSAHNRQPWRFAVLDDAESKDRLARAMGTRLRADRLADGDAADVVERDVARSHGRITGAPAVIVVCLTLADMDAYADARRAEAEYIMAAQGTAMAVGNLLLAARAEGLGACWMCAPLFCPDTVVEALGLPADWRPQALITLGRPADDGRARARKPLADLLWRPPGGR